MSPKQAIPFNFAGSLDTKTDPFQVRLGDFLALKNTVFTKGGLLTKRNGFGSLVSLPNNKSTYVTTFKEDLTAISTVLTTYSSNINKWGDRGSIQPMSVDTASLVRNNLNQTQSDSAIAPNGLICTVYTETDGTTNSYKFVISDSTTGQNIVPPTGLFQPHPTLGTPKVFLLASHFVIVYASAASHLVFSSISINDPTLMSIGNNISTSYSPVSTLAFDGIVLNTSLYVSWNGSGGSGIKMAFLNSSLVVSPTVIVDAGHIATQITVCADTQNNAVWSSYYDSGTMNGFSVAVDINLVLLPNFPAPSIPLDVVLNIASVASNGTLFLFEEIDNVDNGVQTNFIQARTVDLATGAVSSGEKLVRSLGLASKAFFLDGVIYFFGVYASSIISPAAPTFQPTYFLINASVSDQNAPVTISKFAYQNAGGYLVTGLPSVSVIDKTATVSYLFKDVIQAVNKNTNVPTGSQVSGIFSQTGINRGSFTFDTQSLLTSEIGDNLNITGGFLWSYDGVKPVEQNFFLYPDLIQAAWTDNGGNMAAKPDGATNTNAYFYQVTYEWTDNEGNAFRSAPSIPVSVTTTGAGVVGLVTLIVPTLRLTYKISSPVKIVLYRWSVGQQTYFQTTSIFAPELNDTTADSITIVDKNADATILGNNIIYTNGGVVENIGPPASNAMALFDDRLWLLDSEDKNLLWFSKQVIESTPVEMSDLFTVFVAPTTGSQGSTGPISALSSMDDKLVIFKKNAIYYMNGAGPDNTGSNNQYSQPIFVTSTVGCENQKSIVFMPRGLMFQSDKGIWLLGRDLSTEYIGAPVENFNGSLIQSAVNVPETNQVRFTLDSGEMLVYDYYYSKWGTFYGAPAVSSTLYGGLHTIINSHGQVMQEAPGIYLDGSNPVLISFVTGWLNVAGLRGYERIHEFSFLGTYYSPHKLSIQVAYDYGYPEHQSIYSPNNFSPVYGNDPLYGDGTPYGGPSSIEQFRVHTKKQKCKAFQISVQETYDPSFGVAAGAGLSLSGINMVMTLKKGWAPVPGSKSIG